MNSYELFRIFFDWCFENPEKVTPNHVAVYAFAIEHCNRLGWKEKFGFPTEMAKDAIGVKSYKTYINTLNDLVEWGFIKMIERSKNQYSANIIALVKNTKALTKALSKASQKHVSKQDQSTDESIASIDKPENKEPENKGKIPSLWEVERYFEEKGYTKEAAKKAWNYYEAGGWKDSEGKPVLAWKQKMIAVWFKDENKNKAVRVLDINGLPPVNEIAK